MRPGVNVVGDFSAVHGLGEAARRVVDALVTADLDVSLVEASSGAQRDPSRRGAVLDTLPTGRRHPVDLVLLNINEMASLDDADLGRYTIGLWYWELLEVEPEHVEQYHRVDEVWAASDFVAGTFRALGDLPVTTIPAVVPPVEARPLDPGVARLPDGKVTVLFTFDANSSVARKNPFAAVEAFARAFPDGPGGRPAHLVVKVGSSQHYPALMHQLAAAVGAVGGTVVSQDLPRDQMDALLAACDVYLSLHRSEGFGLGMAEAMSLGKPVVATAFGGNTTFMAPDVSCLVGYRVARIHPQDHVLQPVYREIYRPGRRWAEPDVDQAARWLRLLVEDPGLRDDLGRRAARHVADLCGPEAVGARMSARLQEITEALA